MTNDAWGLETRLVHAGTEPDPTTGARVTPIYQTTSFVFRDTNHAAALFGLEELGMIYTRIMNPTQDAFEQRMTSLEGGVGALATSSGQAAQTIALLNLAENGGHIVSSASLYGGTYNQLHYTFPKLGVEVTFIDDPDDLDAWAKAIRPNTKAFYGESIGNPKGDILDFEGVSKVAHDNKIPLVVDNTLASPALLQPDSSRRRRRRAQRDEVHRWPRHVDRWRDRRRWQLRLPGQRSVPRFHRTRPELSRSGVRPVAAGAAPRDVHPQGALAVPARPRCRDRAVQLVPVPARVADVEPAHGAALAERARGCQVARSP